MNKYYEITVTGKGDFPIDMLRYSRCYPVGVEDVANMERPPMGAGVDVGRAFVRDRRTVRLGMTNTYAIADNCVRRFASFGWDGEITKEESL